MALGYDLVLLLDTTVEDDVRAKVVADVEAAIGAAEGSIANKQDWGARTMAFQIDHKPDADYRLIQFSGPPELPGSLHRSLAIDDAVLRHRIIRTPPGKGAEGAPVAAAAPDVEAANGADAPAESQPPVEAEAPLEAEAPADSAQA
jgi:small subunit ribosomal protein S6